MLRKHDICLQRRRSWCIGADPRFGPKAADIAGRVKSQVNASRGIAEWPKLARVEMAPIETGDVAKTGLP